VKEKEEKGMLMYEISGKGVLICKRGGKRRADAQD